MMSIVRNCSQAPDQIRKVLDPGLTRIQITLVNGGASSIRLALRIDDAYYMACSYESIVVSETRSSPWRDRFRDPARFV